VTWAVGGVLFDYGGTLATFERPDAALQRGYTRIAERLRAEGYRPPAATVLLAEIHDRVEHEFAAHRASGSPEEIDLVAAARRAWRDAGIDLPAALLDEVLRIEQEAWWDGVRPDPDAVATLTELRRRRIRVGVCSNAPYRARSLHDQLAHVGLALHLDAAVFSAEVGWRKPHPSIFEAALDALGVRATEALMVGDSEEDDIAGARAMGMRTVLYQRDAHADATATGADAVIHHLRDITGLIAEGPTPILDVPPSSDNSGSHTRTWWTSKNI
jgi:putative hydrolase of the HAD superfamily